MTTQTQTTQPESWTADRLAAVLASAAEEYFASHARVTLRSTAAGTSETYEPEVPEDLAAPDAPLVLVRTSDGARFGVEFWADVVRLADKKG